MEKTYDSLWPAHLSVKQNVCHSGLVEVILGIPNKCSTLLTLLKVLNIKTSAVEEVVVVVRLATVYVPAWVKVGIPNAEFSEWPSLSDSRDWHTSSFPYYTSCAHTHTAWVTKLSVVNIKNVWSFVAITQPVRFFFLFLSDLTHTTEDQTSNLKLVYIVCE